MKLMRVKDEIRQGYLFERLVGQRFTFDKPTKKSYSSWKPVFDEKLLDVDEKNNNKPNSVISQCF